MLKWVLLLAIIARFLAEDSITSGGIWSDFMRASPGTFASFVAWGIFHFTHWDAYFDIFALHDELGEVLHATPADSKALMFEEAAQSPAARLKVGLRPRRVRRGDLVLQRIDAALLELGSRRGE